MRSRDAAVLMFVGLGVFTLVVALGLVASIFDSFRYPGDGGTAALLARIALLLPFLLLLWLAARLIRYREHYAEIVLGEATHEGEPLDSTSLGVLGVSLLGLWAIITSLPSFLQSGAQLVFTDFTKESGAWSPAEYLRLAAGHFAWSTGSLLLGMITVLLRRPITGFIFQQPATPTPKVDSMVSSMRKCPSCGHSYDPSDYRPDAEVIYCTNCREEMPRADSSDT